MNALKAALIKGTAALLSTAFFLQACAFTPPDCYSPQVFCVGFISDVSGLDDFGLNQNAWLTIQQSAQENNFQTHAIESLDTREYSKNIDFFIKAGYDLIITSGFGLGAVTQEKALAQPEILFLGLNQAPVEDKDQPSNLALISFPEDEAGFLAGSLAGLISQTERVGAILPHEEIKEISWYGQGFFNGAKNSNSKIRIELSYNSLSSFEESFNSPLWGQLTAQKSVRNGADVLLIYGGKTGEAAMLATVQSQGLIIGIGKDFYKTLPALQPALLASIVPQPTKQLKQILIQATNGTFSAGVYSGQFEILISKDKDVSDLVREKLSVIQKQLEQGIISTGVEKEEPINADDIF